jgi:hypothetical protein
LGSDVGFLAAVVDSILWEIFRGDFVKKILQAI